MPFGPGVQPSPWWLIFLYYFPQKKIMHTIRNREQQSSLSPPRTSQRYPRPGWPDP